MNRLNLLTTSKKLGELISSSTFGKHSKSAGTTIEIVAHQNIKA